MTPLRRGGRRRALRWLPWVAVAAAFAAALAVGAQRAPGHADLAARTRALASQVRCPVCQGETVEESTTAQSANIRNEIHRQLAAGEKPSAILDGLVTDFGPGILEDPQTHGTTLLLWVLPGVAALAGVIGLVLAFRFWRRHGGGTDVSEDDRVLVAGALRDPAADR